MISDPLANEHLFRGSRNHRRLPALVSIAFHLSLVIFCHIPDCFARRFRRDTKSSATAWACHSTPGGKWRVGRGCIKFSWQLRYSCRLPMNQRGGDGSSPFLSRGRAVPAPGSWPRFTSNFRRCSLSMNRGSERGQPCPREPSFGTRAIAKPASYIREVLECGDGAKGRSPLWATQLNRLMKSSYSAWVPIQNQTIKFPERRPSARYCWLSRTDHTSPINGLKCSARLKASCCQSRKLSLART